MESRPRKMDMSVKGGLLRVGTVGGDRTRERVMGMNVKYFTHMYESRIVKPTKIVKRKGQGRRTETPSGAWGGRRD
jgi:hypothetical protein